MHSSVIEVSRTPVPISERASTGHLPDWFYEQVCDYAENPDQGQRQGFIEQLSGQLDSSCVLDGDKLTISPHIKETYFRKAYCSFKAAAETLAQTDYKLFSGIRTEPSLSQNLDKLNSSYEDKLGVYIYRSESGELVSLDRWLRTADLSQPFYIGGIINYHY